MFNNNINSSRNFYGNSSKLENLQNLYFYLNPYSKSTSINANKQLEQLKLFQSETEENELDKKYGKPIINNYKRFHIKAEEIKKGTKKNLDKNTIYTNYTPEAKNNPNLAFYSVADLSMLHPLTYQKVKSSERYLTSGNLKYNTRLQMVDEKLKKLEEKNECLNVINNIFFDSLKDNITQSLKRKGFLRKHLKDIEYLKQINLEEYNNKVKFLMNLVEEGQIDFDNYNFEGEPLNGIENMVGRIEALKTEIGTMLTKNTMKHDVNLNLLKQDVDNIKDELEKKLFEFSENNNKNYAILKEYLKREEEDRLAEKQKRKRDLYYNRDQFTQEMADKFQIKGIKPEIKIDQTEKETETEKEKKSTENPEENEQSEVSSETNKNIDVIDKILLDSISLSLTSKGGNIKEKSSKKGSNKNKGIKDDNNIEKININENENEIVLTSSSNMTNSKNKKSKKSKWKLLQESEESNLESNIKSNEIKEEDENNNIINTIITGSYKSNFNSNKPEIENKSRRSKRSKKFKLSKNSEKPFEEEENIKSESKIEKSETKKEESNKKEKTESKKEEFEDDKIEGTESSSVTTESFKLTMRSNKVDLHSLKENQEVFLSSDNSKMKDKDKKSKKSKRSKKSKKKNSISQSIKEKSQEEEDDN